MIIISSITFSIDTPFIDPEGWEAKTLLIVDITLTLIFTFEVLIKSIAFGFILNGKESYLRNIWNVIDFIIILISVISFYLTVLDNFCLCSQYKLELI